MPSVAACILCSKRIRFAAVLACTLMLFPACDNSPQDDSEGAAEQNAQPQFESGHDRMLAKLQEIKSQSEEMPFLGSQRAKSLRNDLRWQDSILRRGGKIAPLARWRLLFDSGKAEVRLGNVQLGLKRLHEAYDILPQVDFLRAMLSGSLKEQALSADPNGVYANRTRFQLAVAYLRLAETENCCLQHNSESCILPIVGGGQHTAKDGSKGAIKYLTEILENAPANLDDDEMLNTQAAAQWLLNIAYMTLGEYPEQVPHRHLIPPETFQSEVDFPRFRNVFPDLGLDTFNLCGGAIVDDFDGDGYLDIVTSTWDPAGSMRFFRNNQDGTFDDRSDESGLSRFYGGLNMVQADYDNDGDTDILVLRGSWLRTHGRHPNSLLQNDGRGNFRDRTFEAGLAEVSSPTKTGAWADYDNDGDLDLYIGNEATQDVRIASQLFRSNGDGTFTDVSAESGLGQEIFAMGAVWGDVDGDRFPELYVSTGFSNPEAALRDGGPNKFYLNNRDGTFKEVAGLKQVTEPTSAFAAWFWDYNNDGLLDLYVGCSSGPIGVLTSEYRFGMNCLYRGDGDGGFAEVSEAVGLTYPAQPMGANFGDLNNDGFPDFYLATGNVPLSEVQPNVMFLNQQGQRFVNVTYAGGFGHLQKGHGVCFADIDNDGDQDVYVQMGGAWPSDKFNDALFENPGFENHWITIRLEGRQSNRSAIGARIRAVITDGQQQRSVFRHVNSGGSFGCNPLRQSLGLGRAKQIDSLEIYWPTSDLTQTFTDVEVDQVIHIVEGEQDFRRIDLKRFKMGKAMTGGPAAG